MQIRYNRHLYNLKQHSNKRYLEANPKFYNHINKYGLESLSFAGLLVIKNDLVMFTGFNLSEQAKGFLIAVALHNFVKLANAIRSFNYGTVLFR